MTKDAFGHTIDFGTRLIVGARRKDGKYPVSFIFKSTGARFNKLLTKEALDKECLRDVEVSGYNPPPKVPQEPKE